MSNDSGGKKPEYLERLKRQRRSSAVKFYVTAIVLGSLLGLAYLERAQLKKAYDSFVGSTPEEKAPAAPEATKSIDSKAPAPPTRVAEEKPIEPVKPPPAKIVEPEISLKD